MHIGTQPQLITPPTHLPLIGPASLSKVASEMPYIFRSMHMQSAPSVASLPRQPTSGIKATTHLVSHYRRPIFLLAATSPAASGPPGASTNITPQQKQAAQNLLHLVQSKDSAPAETQLQAAVDNLLATGTAVCNPGTATMTSGSGHWNVIHAPHINRMSSILGTKFDISYTMATPGDNAERYSTATPSPPQFYSNVRYESPLFGSGWLSASGRLFSTENDSVELHFDTFWVDIGGEKSDLRPFITKETTNTGDEIVTALGRITFFEGLAKFPVLYLDTDAGVSVFRFPPLRSNIAVVRQ
ncbi:hypothetical protein Ndes2437B_g00717 [Nannochloris sp. 'desiccata']